MPAPDVYTLTHVLEHTQIPTHSRSQLSELGAGQVPFMNGDSAPLPAPWGLLQMPGVILSLDQWMTFGDTGLGAAGSGDEGTALWCLVMERDPRVRGGQLGQRGPPLTGLLHLWILLPSTWLGTWGTGSDPRAQPVSCGLSSFALSVSSCTPRLSVHMERALSAWHGPSRCGHLWFLADH